tara:strand:+ start:1052 stop:1240 length:189 start_codon:yes stop_codon:yes gene_type:complete
MTLPSKSLLIGMIFGALMLTSACVKPVSSNPYRTGYMYHGVTPQTNGESQLRVLANGELLYR